MRPLEGAHLSDELLIDPLIARRAVEGLLQEGQQDGDNDDGL